jgi:hypothetical protein
MVLQTLQRLPAARFDVGTESPYVGLTGQRQSAPLLFPLDQAFSHLLMTRR